MRLSRYVTIKMHPSLFHLQQSSLMRKPWRKNSSNTIKYWNSQWKSFVRVCSCAYMNGIDDIFCLNYLSFSAFFLSFWWDFLNAHNFHKMNKFSLILCDNFRIFLVEIRFWGYFMNKHKSVTTTNTPLCFEMGNNFSNKINFFI